MSPRPMSSKRTALALSLAAFLHASPSLRAQADTSADERIEEYLEEQGLVSLLTLQLERRLGTSPQEERVKIAERLAGLYAERLEQAQTLEERKLWEDRSREFLRRVNDAEAFELKVSLAKVRYLLAEDLAERARVGLATPEETAEAERVLQSTSAQLHELFADLNQRVRWIERRSSRTEEDEQRLAEARRIRSLAAYYSGWSDYYLAMLTGAGSRAKLALTQFGFILNASEGDEPTIDRLPRGLLRYEHVARAAVGTALAFSLRNQHDRALRWLDAVDEHPETPDPVRKQLFVRRLVVNARAGFWANIEADVAHIPVNAEDSNEATLSVSEARLLAVLTLGAIERGEPSIHARPLVQRLAETALSALVRQGEVGHVLDLVQRYGTAPIGTEGFIVTYVRGLQAYQKARDAHAETGESTDDPTADEAVANLYNSAAGVLRDAVESADAESFLEERARAGISAGLALYYADLPRQASQWLESVFKLAGDTEAAEEALWLAIIAADRALEVDGLSEDRIRALAAIYLQRYPGTERAARLLLRRATSDLLSEEEAIQILLSVNDDELRRSAERHAAALLYRLYRRASGSEKDFAALRFAEVAERVLQAEVEDATTAQGPDAERAGERAITLARQLLDALLGMSNADVQRGQAVLDTIERLAADQGLSLAGIADELAFHRLQIALSENDDEAAERALAELHEVGGAYAEAGDRLMYKRALDRWVRDPADPEAARRVVVHGLNVATQYGSDPDTVSQPAVASLYDRVAEAAVVVWRADDDPQMLEIALEIGRLLIDAGRTSEKILRRHARTTEAAGDLEAALETWRTLLAATAAPDPLWFEARYQTLRLLARLDPARARQVLDQHRVLHPSLGPDPWGPKIAELAGEIPPPPPPAEPDSSEGGP